MIDSFLAVIYTCFLFKQEHFIQFWRSLYLCLSISLSLCLSISLSLCLSISLSLCLYFTLSLSLYFTFSLSLYLSLNISLSYVAEHCLTSTTACIQFSPRIHSTVYNVRCLTSTTACIQFSPRIHSTLYILYFSQKQLPRKRKPRLVIIDCAGYVFSQLFLWEVYTTGPLELVQSNIMQLDEPLNEVIKSGVVPFKPNNYHYDKYREHYSPESSWDTTQQSPENALSPERWGVAHATLKLTAVRLKKGYRAVI